MSKLYWAGHVASALPAIMLLFSGGLKLLNPPELAEGFANLGWDVKLAMALGIVEIGSTILYLVPRTAVLGAILLTGYLGGAIATHVRIGEPFIIPAVLGGLARPVPARRAAAPAPAAVSVTESYLERRPIACGWPDLATVGDWPSKENAMQAKPQKEHEWLHQLVGEWTYEHECVMGPDQPPARMKGTETVRSLGGLWVVCEGQGETPDGGTAVSIMTLGYDSAKKRFVGTFIASMMTYLWLYDGGLAGQVLTLDAEGPSFSGQGMAKYQDIIEFLSPDHRTLTSRLLGEDGKWQQFMQAHYWRRK